MFKNFVKFLLTVVITVYVIPSFAEEASMYVTENLQTFLRSGGGDQYRIVGSITAGTPVTVLRKNEKYSLIRDIRNREGWILNKELTNQQSSRKENPLLKAKIEELTLKLDSLDDSWKQRVSEMQRRTTQAEMQSSTLLEENIKLKREIDTIKNKNRNLETMLDANKQAIAIQWFIYGGSVLGVGLLLGLILPHIIPSRRRKPNGWA